MDLKKIIIINGPNLNMLGKREPDIYGKESYSDINKKIRDYFSGRNITIEFYQSNCEGEIVDKIQEGYEVYDGIIINPGAYSHYSIAILDALLAVNLPAVEVHISNIFKREDFRQKSITSKGCRGVISGFGNYGYIMAIEALLNT